MRTLPTDHEQLTDPHGPACNAATEPVNLEIVLSDGTRRVITAVFRVFKGDRLTLRTTELVSLSTIAAVRYKDVLFIGEVLDSIKEIDSAWIIRIKVKQILTGLTSLMQFCNTFFGETTHLGSGEGARF